MEIFFPLNNDNILEDQWFCLSYGTNVYANSPDGKSWLFFFFQKL